MLSDNMILSRLNKLEYKLKEGTTTSFLLANGRIGILPERLSITKYTGLSGRNNSRFQLQGRYKLGQAGIYYNMNQRLVHTKLIPLKDFPDIIGWGEIDSRFNVYDLIVVLSKSNFKDGFTLYHFKGLALYPSPDNLRQVFHFINVENKKEAIKKASVLENEC